MGVSTQRAARRARVVAFIASSIRAESVAELRSADVKVTGRTSALASHGWPWSTGLAFARSTRLTLVVEIQVVPVYAGCGDSC